MEEIELSGYDRGRELNLPLEITESLAEETGIHLGDGSMNFYRNSGLYSLEGDISKDKEYFIKHLGPLYKKLYNLNVRLRERKCAGVFGFQIGSKGLVNFKNKILGLPLGPKINIEIPEMIKNGGRKIVSAFIRGLFDTDGGVYLEKKYGKLYPRIKISNNSEILMKQVREILEEEFKFNLSMRLDVKTYVIEIRGKENFIKWMKLIGSSNPKHSNKYSKWLSSIGGETLNLG